MSEPHEPPIGLYVDRDELRRRVAPHIGRDRFAAMVKVNTERAGFPPFREEWGGWYWPKVRAWLDSDNGIGNHGAPAATADDAPETFDAAPKQRARPQTRPAPPALLDREAGGERHHGLSGQVHRLGSRR